MCVLIPSYDDYSKLFVVKILKRGKIICLSDFITLRNKLLWFYGKFGNYGKVLKKREMPSALPLYAHIAVSLQKVHHDKIVFIYFVI